MTIPLPRVIHVTAAGDAVLAPRGPDPGRARVGATVGLVAGVEVRLGQMTPAAIARQHRRLSPFWAIWPQLTRDRA